MRAVMVGDPAEVRSYGWGLGLKPRRATSLRICSRPEQAAKDVLPYILSGFRRAVPAMRRGGFGNSCRNCAALVPAYLFSGMKILNGVGPGGRLEDDG